MHFEILNSDQAGLLPILKLFRKEFYWVGGTAIALQIGHRRSIDFDLFSLKPFGSKRLLNVLEKAGKQTHVTRRIDYSEKVDYMPGFKVDDEIVRQFLIEKALEGVI